MHLRSCSLVAVFFLLCHPGVSLAQAVSRPLELTVDVGTGGLINGVRRAQSARSIGGTIGWRPFRGPARRIGLELKAAQLKHDEGEIGGADFNHLNARLVSGNALLHFRPDAAAQPYLIAGIGVINADASTTGAAEHGSDAAWVGGAGFKARAAKHVVIRGEILFGGAFKATYDATRADGSVNRFIGPWGWQALTIGAGLRF